MPTLSATLLPALNLRQRVDQLLETAFIQHLILGLILLNALTLGLETSSALMASHGPWLMVIDRVLLSIFVVELLLRIYARRLAFFRDPWSLFDFTVVAIALIPASGPFAVLRALRVLRVFRVLTLVPSMRKVVGALLSAIPGLLSIAAVLLVIYYVFAVIATKLFGTAFPEWFGSLGHSLYTLFQVMTLESWSMGISRPVMEIYPYAWAFFIPFILIATFTMLNLFIAIIVNTMQSFSDSNQQQTVAAIESSRSHIEDELHQEVRALRSELAELRELLRQPR